MTRSDEHTVAPSSACARTQQQRARVTLGARFLISTGPVITRAGRWRRGGTRMATSAGSPDGASGGSGPLGGDERAELVALRHRVGPRRRLRAFLSAALITLAALL